MSISRKIEVITEADLDTATAEAVSIVDAHCPVQRTSSRRIAGRSVVIIEALFGNEFEVEAKASEIRRSLGKYGMTDTIAR